MKVFVVGPVSPFRGGIAKHTQAIAQELVMREGIELSVVSFSRMYPSVFYPGHSDRSPEEQCSRSFDANYSLDSVNPFTWFKVATLIVRESPDVVVIPAWTFFLAPCLGTVARILRKAKIPVIMVVHNAYDHEAVRWKIALSRFQLRQAAMFIAHNDAVAFDLERVAPNRPVSICQIPVFDSYPEPSGELIREADLELLFFGLVRHYKGLDIALRALALMGPANVRLSIVGEFWEPRSETEQLIAELGLEARVEIVDRYVSDQEAAEYFARSDAVVLPYRSATGSGVVALAQHYARPVVSSDVPGLADAIRDGETGWVFPTNDTEALARILSQEVTRARCAAMSKAILSDRAATTWESYVNKILEPDFIMRNIA